MSRAGPAAVARSRAGLAHHRVEAVDEGDGGDATGRPARGGIQRAPETSTASGFSQTTCLPAASASLDERTMQIVRRADVDNVDVGDCEHVVGRRANPRSAPRRVRGVLGALGGRCGDADDAGTGHAGPRGRGQRR